VTTLLFGVETEYAVSGLGRRGMPIDRGQLLEDLMSAARARLVHLPQSGGAGLFVGNGGRLYVDAGHHLEFSTPECARPEDVVRFVRAGDRIVGDLAQAVASQRSDLEDVVVLRTNVDYTPHESTTWGSHESFMHRVEPARLPRQLIPHLVSRIVYTGAGGFVSSRPDEIAFTLSPRVWHLESEISAASTTARGIFHTKDETLAEGGYHRLHLICGESVCSDTALWLRIATTALIVALIDAGLEPGEDVQVRAPLAAMRVFASDPSCRATAPLENGAAVTAIDIQRHYLTLVRRHVAHPAMPDWAAEVCQRWGAILDRLAVGPDAVTAEVDWAAKLTLFRRHTQQRGLRWEERAAEHGAVQGVERRRGSAQLSLRYQPPPRRSRALPEVTEAHDGVEQAAVLERDQRAYERLQRELFEVDMRFGQLGEQGLFTALQRAGALHPPLVDDAAVARAVARPPAIGRAALRGNAIRRLHKRGATTASCDWTAVWDHTRDRTLVLVDPLASRVRWTSGRIPVRAHLGLPPAQPQADSLFWSATALHNEGRLGEAAAMLDELLRSPVPDDLLYKALTRRVLIDEDIPLARREIEAAIEAAERCVADRGHAEWRSRFLHARARLLEACGLYDDALATAVEGLERQAVEHNGIATETHMRQVLVLCLRTGHLAEAGTYVENWLGMGTPSRNVQALSLCGRSELARAAGDADAAVQWSELATGLREPMAFLPLRRMIGEAHARALLCQGDPDLAEVTLRACALRRDAESGAERYNARLLWADYQLARAQSAAGVPIVDPVHGAHFAPSAANSGGHVTAACALRRAARAYNEALREGRVLDALLECDVREREIAARKRLLEQPFSLFVSMPARFPDPRI